MEKIASFTVDHLRLKRGIFVSRKDSVGTEVVTTFDIRMKEPNREPVLHPDAIHTIEHLAATFLRNHPQWGDKIIYWGPMGCLTGNYLIVKGDLQSADILPRHSGSVLTRKIPFENLHILALDGSQMMIAAHQAGRLKRVDMVV